MIATIHFPRDKVLSKCEATCISCRLGADFPCFPSQSSARKTFSITIRRKHPPRPPSEDAKIYLPSKIYQTRSGICQNIPAIKKQNILNILKLEDAKIYLPSKIKIYQISYIRGFQDIHAIKNIPNIFSVKEWILSPSDFERST